MRKCVLTVVLIVMVAIFTSVSAEGFNRSVLEEAGLQIEDVYIHIPGITHTYHFLWLSDLHIVIDNEEIAEDQHEFVKGRQTSWAIRSDGKQAGDWWVEGLAGTINSSSPDAIFFGGDMLDLCTEATVNMLKQGLEKITVPWIYIRADHDYETHWLREPDLDKNLQMQSAICDYEGTVILEYQEFIIIGINNSTSVMSDEAVEQAKAVTDKGKPIIVLTHVPYNSLVDTTLDETSRLTWQDRNLSWGDGTSYTPNEIMSEWMEKVYEEDSPVVEVLAGHLHYSWDGMISETVHEHVFGAGFSGYVGLITVDGE